jgi:hypothetical protein
VPFEEEKVFPSSDFTKDQPVGRVFALSSVPVLGRELKFSVAAVEKSVRDTVFIGASTSDWDASLE